MKSPWPASMTWISLPVAQSPSRSEEHTSELQSQSNLVCRLLLEKKKKDTNRLVPGANTFFCCVANRFLVYLCQMSFRCRLSSSCACHSSHARANANNVARRVFKR